MKAQEKRRLKTLLYEQFARVGKALANAHRLELLDVLSQGERSVEALARETGMPIRSASQHLQVLLKNISLQSVLFEVKRVRKRILFDDELALWVGIRESLQTV